MCPLYDNVKQFNCYRIFVIKQTRELMQFSCQREHKMRECHLKLSLVSRAFNITYNFHFQLVKTEKHERNSRSYVLVSCRRT